MAKKDIRTSTDSQEKMPYPKHAESFHKYYYLGESRTLFAAAKKRYQELVIESKKSGKKIPTEDSFYTKIKRWAKNENWKEWVLIKQAEDRRKQGGITFSKDENKLRLLALRALIRDALDVFSYKVDLHIQVKKALEEGDIDRAQKLNKKLDILGRVDMGSFESVEAMVDLQDKILDIIKNRSVNKIS